ncbi:MAG: formate dehydrogenase subunit gamma [Gammaproteobacteria bacterium]|nr:MAG: formate dehydrogenase subunit gamma [Gammaproteobacteria bacterium]
MINTNKLSDSDFIKEFLLFLIITTITLMGLIATPVSAAEQKPTSLSAVVPNPATDLWREVRQRGGPVVGKTQVGGTDAGVLINTQGQAWRELRTVKIIPYSVYLLAVVLIVLIAFRLIRGQIKINAGRSAKRILRFTLSQRVVHWFAGITFLILGITGVILLLGRTLLIPIMGNSAFGNIAAFSKLVHNYIGPVFAVSLVLLFIYYVKDNFFKGRDMMWFLKGGGFFGGHAHAGRYNAGEKTWFWLSILVGLVVVVTGLILNFPIFGLDRAAMELSLVVHGISSVILFAISLGHIYIATIGMEGALETMTTGYCDANWAKEHHDIWYEEVKDTEEDVPPPDAGDDKAHAVNTTASPNPT